VSIPIQHIIKVETTGTVYWMTTLMPPSAMTIAPTMKLALSDARNAITFAMPLPSLHDDLDDPRFALLKHDKDALVITLTYGECSERIAPQFSHQASTFV
jgi:hypothetical protein